MGIHEGGETDRGEHGEREGVNEDGRAGRDRD